MGFSQHTTANKTSNQTASPSSDRGLRLSLLRTVLNLRDALRCGRWSESRSRALPLAHADRHALLKPRQDFRFQSGQTNPEQAMRSRTWPIMVAGFGALLALIGILGWEMKRRAAEIQQELTATHEAFRSREQALNQLQSAVLLSSIFVRDSLLDRSQSLAHSHREQLTEYRSSISRHLEELEKTVSSEERRLLQNLKAEVDIYWKTLNPLFGLSSSERVSLGLDFLRTRVLPRRQAVLSMAKQIRAINETNFEREQDRLRSNQEAFQRSLVRLIAGVLGLGVIVACVVVFRLAHLEKRASEQRTRTERAEQELRRLSQQLVRAQEDERRTLSRELHDEIGQLLTALRMELSTLEELRKVEDFRFNDRLNDARDLAGQALNGVRDLAMGLRPSVLDDLGLAPALRWQAREFSRRSGIPVTVEIDGSLEPLPESHRTCIYRVTQESLTNVARHARARNIRVTLQGDSELLRLAVQDDGIGFDSRMGQANGLGLIGIEERVRQLGGRVSIVTETSKGTLLQIQIPRPQEVQA
jgi:signal transduction histidine kinase